MSRRANFALVTTAIIAMTAGIWLGQSSDPTSTSSLKPAKIQGAIYPQAKKITEFDLTNQNSEAFKKSDFLNHWSLVFVGYTNCPDVCPTTLSVLNQVDQYMREQQLTPPTIIFLSIDPERDSPESLKNYVEYFNKDFMGVTGSIKEITQLSRQLNAVFKKAPGLNGQITEDNYLMDHSSALMLINPNGNLQSILTAPHLPGTIIESTINSQAYYDILNE